MTLLPAYYKFVLIDSLSVASMLGFTCHVVRVFTTFAPCLEHVCAGGGECSKYGFDIIISEGIIDYTLIL